ncbi:MAG: hypothetical protein BWZ02_02760 [Lentisphaerae bacterium ADurb.BinA184]|nr:MAG: hypothetical protein BWZ02_02760 [Lentisphaerae bacterium ADurb.BinA184]
MRKALLIVLTGLVALVCGVLNSAAEAPAPADPSAAPSADPSAAPAPAPLPEPLRPNKVRVAQLVAGTAIHRASPNALPSLLAEAARLTTLPVIEQPTILASFEDPALFRHPFVYANFIDRPDWAFTPLEQQNLRQYLERGGFLFIDAGISAEFLREDDRFGQQHSFGEWDACPEIKDAFRAVFPDRTFQPLKRSHDIFRSFFRGLPDPAILPDSVRDYVVNEKWPEGTYSVVAIEVAGRPAVIATPIISMGWGRDPVGNWMGSIAFRILEGGEGLSERLPTASYSGRRFDTIREDGRKDIIYCQEQALPAWVQEPEGRWRVFRYYQSREISDYAHTYFTRLGVNILVYALTQ